MHPRGAAASSRPTGCPAWLRLPGGAPGHASPRAARRARADPAPDRAGRAVALGHSGAMPQTALRGVDAGAGSSPMSSTRWPRLTIARRDWPAWRSGPTDVGVGVIADGVHVDPLVLELCAARPSYVSCSSSDATAGAAAPPGHYELAGTAIETDGAGPARSLGGKLAGSTLTLDEAVRRWSEMTDASLAEAIASGSEAARAVIGLPQPLTPGAAADLVVLNDAGAVSRVMRRGRWLAGCGD